MVYCFRSAWVENIISRQAVRCLSLNTSYVNQIMLCCQQASWQDPLWFCCHYVMTTPAEIVLVKVERCSRPPCVRHKNISQYTSHSLKTLFDQQMLLNMILKGLFHHFCYTGIDYRLWANFLNRTINIKLRVILNVTMNKLLEIQKVNYGTKENHFLC